jgi:hypothetical protein
MATLGLAPRARWAALKTALRFAVGHALVLALLSGVCLASGVALSERFERGAELVGGGLLVLLALTALFLPGVLHHGHPHLPSHASSHRHLRFSAAAGGLLALSGGRALLMALAPLLVGGGLGTSGWVYLPGFALGILVSMGAVGLLLSLSVARLGERALRRAYRVTALSSGLLGLVWIAQH